MRWVSFLLGLLVAAVLLCAAAGSYLAEGVIRGHPLSQPSNDDSGRVTLRAADGVLLVGRFTAAPNSNHRCVILLHGSGSSRRAMRSLEAMFQGAGYATLAPDSRGHGESGGDFVTYGLAEGRDLTQWVDGLSDDRCSGGIFAVGESMGAAALLTSLKTERRIRAAVAESSFASFETVAAERVGRRMGLPFVGQAFVGSGLLYLRLRYGFDLTDLPPSAAAAVPPILFIHGLLDNETLPEHSRALHRRYPNSALWEVENAAHCGAFGTAPAEFQRRVLHWFGKVP